MSQSLEETFRLAFQHHWAGRLAEAESLYRRILAACPGHPDTQHLLGALAGQNGRHEAALDFVARAIRAKGSEPSYYNTLGNALKALGRCGEAMEAYRRALALNPDYADSHYNLGVVLQGLERLAEAEACYRRLLALRPDCAEAHNNLGSVFLGLGRSGEAEASYRRALALNSDYAEAHGNLGAALRELGRPDEAEACHRRALALRPDYPEAHYNLGAALQSLGRPDEAATCYRRAVALKPDYAEAHNNLGAALQDLGRLEEAEACHRRALAIKPGCPKAGYNLGRVLNDLGRPAEAMALVLTLLAARDSRKDRLLFAHVFKALDFNSGGDPATVPAALTEAAIRALSEGWSRAKDLAMPSLGLVRRNPAVRAGVELAMAAWPGRPAAGTLPGGGGWRALGEDVLLRALLLSGPIPDLGMERYLTCLRLAMLEQAEASSPDDDALEFSCTVAGQCFLTEYVFAGTDDEVSRARRLRDSVSAALESGAAVPPVRLAVAAAYGPLHALAGAGRLVERSWPPAIRPLLVQQLDELEEEARLRAGIPRLTTIEDAVSQRVREQYEESPYPRWTVAGYRDDPETLDAHVRRKCPLAPFSAGGRGHDIDILIAGCGTGQHPIGTARIFPQAHILAIDLSLASLGYALRKTRELGIGTIDYAQADLLQIGGLNRSFDLIESVGVLHHLEDPMKGWRALAALLRPGGFMRLGLYSELARRNVVAARDFIAGRGYGQSPDDIRRCRQEMMATDGPWQGVAGSGDFFSLSEARDLLFHVQEHRLTLEQIAAFLSDHGLAFIGFDAEAALIRRYRQRFPEDPAAIDLTRWHRFELDNPTSFARMYQFWIWKPA